MASLVKNLPAMQEPQGDTGSVPGLERSPEEENGNPFQYSHLGNPIDRVAWLVTVHGVTKELNMTKQQQQ